MTVDKVRKVRKYRTKRIVGGKRRGVPPWAVKFGVAMTLLTTVGIMVGGAWLSLMLIINPDSVVWLNRYLPEWTRIPLDVSNPPQTLAEIRLEAREAELRLGEAFKLDSEVLFPLWRKQINCQTNCEKIVELRVYQPIQGTKQEEQQYRLVRALDVPKVEEIVAIAPLRELEKEGFATTRSLPFHKLSELPDSPPSGVWLNLSGEFVRTDTKLLYGYIFHYNPNSMHLSPLMEWSTTTGKIPQWQEVTGGRESTQELLIDQSVGLEPKFKVFHLKPRNFAPDPISLEEISLREPAIDQPALKKEYQQVFALSSDGLWSPALKRFQTLKDKATPEEWNPQAQEQLDVIALHAKITKEQCEKPWASPSQQILACLIDGRLKDSLDLFQVSLNETTAPEITTLLKTDSGRLWKRVQAALEVNPQDFEAKAWGALILASQQDRKRAISWLEELPQNQPETLAKIKIILDQLDNVAITVENTPMVSLTASRIIGLAQRLESINSQAWLPYPDPVLLPLEGQQTWYQIQVSTFNNGSGWQKPPFPNLQPPQGNSGKELAKQLGLEIDSRIEIAAWTQGGQRQSILGAIKAVQFQGGVLKLLAVGDNLANLNPGTISPNRRPFAHSVSALNWLEPGSVSLADLNQMQPDWVAKLLPAIWRDLQAGGKVASGEVPKVAELLSQIGHWSIRPVDLTGNDQPEAILTLYEETSGNLDNLPGSGDTAKKPRTMIVSDAGTVIYSEFTKNQGNSWQAIADLGEKGSSGLLVDSGKDYLLKRWSAKTQGFE